MEFADYGSDISYFLMSSVTQPQIQPISSKKRRMEIDLLDFF